jgi:predicted ATPase/class 3 adenylate cyclase
MSASVTLPGGWVTFLFTDIEGSTRLAQVLGSAYRAVLIEHRAIIRSALHNANAIEVFAEGDSIFAVFDSPTEALAACAQAQGALTTHQWPAGPARPRVRMGLHTGHVQPSAGEYASPEVHRAARVAAAAHGGQVLCSASTQALAGSLSGGLSLIDLGLHRLRGFDGHERLFQLVGPDLERRFPRPRTDASASHNLPGAATSFVGRRRERAVLHALLQAHRQVTVVGGGGAGKSRLSVEVARALVADFPDGVWFTDLVDCATTDEVAVAIAAACAVRPEAGRPVIDTLAGAACDQRLLLVLDTCDSQPTAVAAVLARLLGASREIRILATSREPLGLPGETVWRIPSMGYTPGADGQPGDAVQLLTVRATAARGGRAPAGPEAAALATIARLVDGLPLALELAAARLRMMSAAELASRLAAAESDASDLMGTLDAGTDPVASDTRGPDAPISASAPVAGEWSRPAPRAGGGMAAGLLRHATMRATVGWSYRTLPPAAARLLRLMSVFSAPAELAAIAWLVDQDPFDALTMLVNKSLVHVELGSPTRYRLVEPVRAFAAHQLAAAGEEGFARGRHAQWALHALRRANTGVDGRPLTQSLPAIEALVPEVRAALRWSGARGSARAGIDLAASLDLWARETGHAEQAAGWYRDLLDRATATGEQIPDPELAGAYLALATHTGILGDHVAELRSLELAETLAAGCGDVALLTRVRAARGVALAESGQPETAETHCREVIATASAQGVAAEAMGAVYCLGQLLWLRGEVTEAAELLGAARPAEAANPVERGRRTLDMLLGLVALSRGDLVAAHDHLTVALRYRDTNGFQMRAAETLHAFAVRCVLSGDLTSAATLFGAAASARARLQCPLGLAAVYWSGQETTAREALGDRAFDAAYASGGMLSLPDAVALALQTEPPDLDVESARFDLAGDVTDEITPTKYRS